MGARPERSCARTGKAVTSKERAQKKRTGAFVTASTPSLISKLRRSVEQFSAHRDFRLDQIFSDRRFVRLNAQAGLFRDMDQAIGVALNPVAAELDCQRLGFDGILADPVRL